MCCNFLNRRKFIELTAAGMTGASVSFTFAQPSLSAFSESNQNSEWDPELPLINTGQPLRIQPVLMYRVSERKEQTSWKSWGGIQTEQAAIKEIDRICGAKNRNNLGNDLKYFPCLKIHCKNDSIQKSL